MLTFDKWHRSVNGVSQEQVMLSGLFGLVNSVLAVTENLVGILTLGILG